MDKALLADDSLTIQKVIKITLAIEPYHVVNCKSEEDLFKKIESEKPQLVFLDFSISDERNGYEVCADIIKSHPKIAILMLFGTFDSVDENKLKACGASEKIVKPFDSSKFINLCKKMTEKLDKGLESKRDESITDLADSEDWTIEEDKVGVSSEDATQIITAEESSSIEEKLEDWGVPVPGVIVKENAPELESMGAIPAVIGAPEQELEEEPVLAPSEEDLEYPDPNLELVGDEQDNPAPKSKLVPLDEINNEPLEESNEIEDVGAVGGAETDSDVEKILGQIQDEVNKGDLWSVDEYEVADADEITGTSDSALNFDADGTQGEQLAEEEKIEQEPKALEIEQDKLDVELESVPEKSDVDSLEVENPAQSYPGPDLNSEEFKEIVEAKVQSMVEDMVKERIDEAVKKAVQEFCEKSVESIAWEVIPDLAENNIKNEIKKISESILNQE